MKHESRAAHLPLVTVHGVLLTVLTARCYPAVIFYGKTEKYKLNQSITKMVEKNCCFISGNSERGHEQKCIDGGRLPE